MTRGRRAVVVAALALALPGCGGGSGEPAGSVSDGSASSDTVLTGPATSNVSIDSSSDGDTVAVGWYAYDETSGVERALVATSVDGGVTFGETAVVAEPAIEYPDVAVLDDGTILVGSITYDVGTVIDPGDERSWPGWPMIHRSTDGGRSFEVLADLRDTIGPRVLTGTMPTSLAAADDGSTIVFTFQDNTPAAFVDDGDPSRIDGTSAIPTWAVVSTDGGETFAPPQLVAPSTCSCCQSTAFVAGGRAGVAMRLLDPVGDSADVRDTAINLADDAGRFGSPVEIHDDGYEMPLAGCPASGPGVIEAGGILHAAWWTGADGRRGWWYARGTSPDDLGEPVPLEAVYTITYAVHVAATDTGRAWVVGMHWADDNALFHLNLWAIDADGRPTLLDDAPPVAVSAQAYDITAVGDRALVAWIDGDAVHLRTLT